MKTIFIVDDEKDIRDSLEGVFTDEGYKVETAESAEEALEGDLPISCRMSYCLISGCRAWTAMST